MLSIRSIQTEAAIMRLCTTSKSAFYVVNELIIPAIPTRFEHIPHQAWQLMKPGMT